MTYCDLFMSGAGVAGEIRSTFVLCFCYGFLHLRDCLVGLTKYISGPVVQSVVSLTSLVMVKILTVLSNSQLFLLKEM